VLWRGSLLEFVPFEFDGVPGASLVAVVGYLVGCVGILGE
jgi:hypothetical protein